MTFFNSLFILCLIDSCQSPMTSQCQAVEERGSYPDLLHRLHGLLLDQFEVEGRGQDEDEHGRRRRSCGHRWNVSNNT